MFVNWDSPKFLKKINWTFITTLPSSHLLCGSFVPVKLASELNEAMSLPIAQYQERGRSTGIILSRVHSPSHLVQDFPLFTCSPATQTPWQGEGSVQNVVSGGSVYALFFLSCLYILFVYLCWIFMIYWRMSRWGTM